MVVIFTINLYMMHTCTNTPLLIVFKEQVSCALLVIYYNVNLCVSEVTEVHVPCSEGQQCGFVV